MIYTGLSKEEVIRFISTELPLKIYAIKIDDNTLILHKVRNEEDIKRFDLLK